MFTSHLQKVGILAPQAPCSYPLLTFILNKNNNVKVTFPNIILQLSYPDIQELRHFMVEINLYISILQDWFVRRLFRGALLVIINDDIYRRVCAGNCVIHLDK